MKAKLLEVLAIGAATALCAQVSFAQNETHSTTQDQSKQSGVSAETASQAGGSATSELRLTKAKDATVKSSAGDKLGKLDDLIVDTQSGQVKFAILGHGGILGIGEKRLPVPWQALNMTSENEFSLNMDKDKLKSAPTTDSKYADLQNPQFVASLYQFYEVQPQAMGGSEAGIGGGTESGAGSSVKHHKHHMKD